MDIRVCSSISLVITVNHQSVGESTFLSPPLVITVNHQSAGIFHSISFYYIYPNLHQSVGRYLTQYFLLDLPQTPESNPIQKSLTIGDENISQIITLTRSFMAYINTPENNSKSGTKFPSPNHMKHTMMNKHQPQLHVPSLLNTQI